MHPDSQFHYELIHSLEVPEIAPMPSIRSERAATIARWFGIEDQIAEAHTTGMQPSRTDRAMLRSLLPRAGQITFFTGASGAGKSSMLRELRSLRSSQTRHKTRWIDLNADIALPDRPIVDCFENAELDRTLALLSHVGLAEAWSYLRTPSELSEGQRWRLKLALAMHAVDSRSGGSTKLPGADSTGLAGAGSTELTGAKPQHTHRTILVADEFAALLDRVTAAIVARCLRRSIDATPGLAAIVATSHDDLTRALVPELIVSCDFRLIEVRRRALAPG